MANRNERRRARAMAVQLLYEEDITGNPDAGSSKDVSVVFDENPIPAYTKQLISDYRSHSARINDLIAASSKNWSLDRMPVADRAIMRMALAEILCEDAIPVSVSINEAVELARFFGGEKESPQFTNGILGNIVRSEHLDEDANGADDDASAGGANGADDADVSNKDASAGGADGAGESSGDRDV